MADKNLSFLPEDYLEKRAARRTNVICLSLFGVVLVGVVAAFFVTSGQRADAIDRLTLVKAEFAEAARRLEQLEELQDRKHQMVHKAHVTSVLVERIPRSLILAELINHMPDTLSLIQLDMDTTELRTATTPRTAMQRQQEIARQRQELEAGIVQVPETQVTIKLVGLAPTDVEVAQYMAALGQHEMFHDVELIISEQKTVEQQPMREFRVQMKLNQQVDVHQLEPKLVRRDPLHSEVPEFVPIDAPEGFDGLNGAPPARNVTE